MPTAEDNARVPRLRLDDRYRAESGTVFMTGLQALLRVLLDQTRVDRLGGLRTAGLISGYPGSPLGGVDMELMRHAQLFADSSVEHQLGLNEELAATAVYGTQLLHDVPDPKYDGVFGMWFGKAPGVDRAADALHHANFHGVARNGGVLAVAGDDPHARSTIVPSDSNSIFSSFYMPVLAPGDVQEVLDFGLHGYALSRASGLWVGFKLVSDVADASQTVEVKFQHFSPRLPDVIFDGQPHRPIFRANEAGAPMIEREREVYYARLEIAREYARLNGLNRLATNPPRARFGIVAGGKTYFDLREALRQIGYDDEALEAAGIRILKLGLLYPFDERSAREFSKDLTEVLVVEDKRPFLELFLKDSLYGLPEAPRIIGKRDADGELLLTACGELSSDIIASALKRWFVRLGLPTKEVGTRSGGNLAPAPLPDTRTPYFCSGCPHNRSLHVPKGAVVGAGIGCHIMTLWMGPVFGDVVGYTQMGGEGAQWVGLHRFSGTQHYFQNIGDGTLAHSGSLAIRFAVAAGVNITYKILYNSAVAMTGGQAPFGAPTVHGLVRQLESEGVKKIIVTTEDPSRYQGTALGSIASVRHRDELLDAERELAQIAGVTALINDQHCAAEKRRLRKRGRLNQAEARVVINERVCEGCGDCGAKSNCLSVEPVETEFGRKTRINQSSCNQDYSCLLGDCPSFMTIAGAPAPPLASIKDPEVALKDPRPTVPEHDFSVFMAGIGGTGVITVNQILGMAASIAGRHVRAIDQLGSSQKAGPVTSHLRISSTPCEGGARIMSGQADLFMAFDLLCATDPVNLAVASTDRTRVVAAAELVPTGAMVTDANRARPSLDDLRSRLRDVSGPDPIYIEALAISRHLFGNEIAANMVVTGAAYQAGTIPLPLDAIEAAIRLNGVAVESNLRAFRWGRYCVQAPDVVHAVLAPPTESSRLVVTVDEAIGKQLDNLQLSTDVTASIRIRVSELCSYQNEAYAIDYVAVLQRIRDEERKRGLDSAVTEAAAFGLYKLMAYKDEYEVARLLVADYDARLNEGRLDATTAVHWYLHPTFMRAIGMKKKAQMGVWFIPIARALSALKALRGTAFDPFGRTIVRREERRLVREYKESLQRAVSVLNRDNAQLIAKLARLPDLIRGYEDIKLQSIGKYSAERERILRSIERPAQRTVSDRASTTAG